MPILDAYGNPVKSGKPITDEIGGVSSIRDRYSTYPSQGLTPERLTSIFKQADTGDVSRQAELYEEMEEKDAHLGAVLQTRKLAIAGLPWEVTAASEDKEDVRIADFVREAIGWIENWDEALVGMLDAVGKGFSVSEIMWELDEKKYWIKDIRWRHQKKFTLYSRDRVLDYPMLITDANPVYGEELAPFKFIFHRAGGRAGNVPRAGVLRAAAWMYLFKNYTLKDWVVYNERFAMPLRVGKYQAGASEEERKVLRNAVFNLGADAAAVISESTVIDLLEGQKYGSVASYEKLVAYLNATISKAVLGHSASADSTPGKLGSETEAREVRRDILEADAKALAMTIRMQLIYPLVVYNFGPDRNLPKCAFQHEAEEDLGATATTYKTLIDMGFDGIPKKHVHEKFGIPEPEKDEDTVRPAAPAPLPFKKDICACGKHHGQVRRIVMASRQDAPDWVETYLERLAPSLKGVREDALRKIEAYLSSQSSPPPFEEFDIKVRGILVDAYAGIDHAAIQDTVAAIYSWHKLTDLLAPGIETAFGGADVRAVDFLSKLDTFYHSKWAKNPEVNRAITDFLKEQYIEGGEGLFGRGDPTAIAELKDLLSQKMVELEYNQVSRIVDTSVQRARNWAHTAQLYDAGAVEIQILEPTRDCDFCAAMHEQVIRVETAHGRMRAEMDMTPEEYEEYLKSETNRAVVGNELSFIDRGKLPPYHPRCHGTVVMKVS